MVNNPQRQALMPEASGQKQEVEIPWFQRTENRCPENRESVGETFGLPVMQEASGQKQEAEIP